MQIQRALSDEELRKQLEQVTDSMTKTFRHLVAEMRAYPQSEWCGPDDGCLFMPQLHLFTSPDGETFSSHVAIIAGDMSQQNIPQKVAEIGHEMADYAVSRKEFIVSGFLMQEAYMTIIRDIDSKVTRTEALIIDGFTIDSMVCKRALRILRDEEGNLVGVGDSDGLTDLVERFDSSRHGSLMREFFRGYATRMGEVYDALEGDDRAALDRFVDDDANPELN